jgi:cob(I)alamin adenosyltransferase
MTHKDSVGGADNPTRDKPVVLSRIYTRTGDDGTTTLGDMSRTAKTDPRLAAYADAEEANCAIGTALALGGVADAIDADAVALLGRVQNELFDLGADLCVPMSARLDYPPLRIDGSYVTRLEEACDRYNADLPTLRSFILPGGSPTAAALHTARTVARRAERTAWAAVEAHGDDVNREAVRYLNRLSDLLFILARAANLATGDVLWKPGGER